MRVHPAEIVGEIGARERSRFVAVADPAGEVVVRWRLGHCTPWRCPECGHQETPTCEHTFTAALLLAEHLLGLKRVPQLNPSTKETTDA